MTPSAPRYYMLVYKTPKERELLDFLDRPLVDKCTFIHWLRFFPRTYILVVTHDSTWNLSKLTDKLAGILGDKSTFMLTRIENGIVSGYLGEEDWKLLKSSQNIETDIVTTIRSTKIARVSKNVRKHKAARK